MKKSFLLSLMMLTGVFAFANNENGDTKNSEPKQVNNQTVVAQPTSEEKTDDDALYCEVEKQNGDKVWCILCNCEKLADRVLNGGNKAN